MKIPCWTEGEVARVRYTRKNKDFCLEDKIVIITLEEEHVWLRGDSHRSWRTCTGKVGRGYSDMSLYETCRHLESQQMELGLVKLRWINVLKWEIVHVVNHEAAIGSNSIEDVEVHKNANFEEILNLLRATQKLILDHSDEYLDEHCLMIKWSSGQNHKYVFTQIPCCALGRSSDRLSILRCLRRISGNRWRVRVECFPRSSS